MNEVIQVFGGLTIKDIIIYGVAIYALYMLGVKIYEKTTEMYNKEQKEKTVKEQVAKNTKAIAEVAEKLEKIEDLMLKEIERQKSYQRQSLQDKIFSCYSAAKARGGVITRSQLENFEKNVKEYERLSMNGLVHEKYKPEVYKMEVIED